LISSERIDHLPEGRGEVVDDDAPERIGQDGPDVGGLDRHASSLSPTRASNASIAARLSLATGPGSGGRVRRLVAGQGCSVLMKGGV
jgi:hypothetical protein